MICEQHPWGLADGMVCTGIGEPHAHVFIASNAPDAHTASEDAAESSRG